ncbi:MAG: phage adaptor protein [Methyloceanibacter sp.]
MAYTYSILTGPKTTLGSIKNWTNRSDIPSAFVLAEAQALIYEKLRVREMETTEDITVASGEYRKEVTIPEVFLDPIKIVPFGWGEELPYVSVARFATARDPSTGDRLTGPIPSNWTLIGNFITFEVELDADFGFEFFYYRKPAPLGTGAAETNFLTDRYPTLLRYACMSFAFDHMKDSPRSLEYRQKTELLAAEINRTNELYRRGQYL